MPLPRVAIVGRPNVGKSSLFNCLANRRIAIVDSTAGTTRDRIATPIQTENRTFELVDTGGMGIEDVDNLTDDVEKQIAIGINEAALILFVVDVRDGIVPLDLFVAEKLRKLNKPVILIANKCDVMELEVHAQEFHQFGYGAPLTFSAHHQRNKATLLERIESALPEDENAVLPEKEMKIAIVGRRNVGKSTLINALAQEERVIVSEVAGTTRDSVDVRFERDGQAFLAIDTAGLRKKGSLANDIEFYSLHRAQRSIRRADVVMQLFDPRDTISKVDKQLADYILENHKPAIFVVNKWDLAKDKIHTGKWADYLHKLFPALDYVPIVFITAKTSKNVWALLNLAQSIFKQANARVGTSELNRVLEMAMERRSPPVRLNKSPRIYFGTQVSTNPPTIVLKTNGPELFPDTYIRYLLGVFREQLPFKEVPIKLHLRDKTGSMKESESSEPEAIEASAPPKTKPKVKAKTSQQPAKGTRADVWRDV